MTALVVVGLGRCGLSLTMQVLERGGAPVYGDFPGYEQTPLDARWWRGLPVDDRAVKLVDPIKLGVLDLPDHATHAVVLRRNATQQALSGIKLLGMPMDRAHFDRFVQSYRDGQRRLESWARETFPNVTRLSFEQLVGETRVAVMRLGATAIHALGGTFDVAAGVAAVRPRGPECLDRLLELELIDEAKEKE